MQIVFKQFKGENKIIAVQYYIILIKYLIKMFDFETIKYLQFFLNT